MEHGIACVAGKGVRDSWVIGGAFLLLALPSMIFCLGWLEWYVSVPLGVALAGCVASVVFGRSLHVIRLSRGHVWKLLVLLLVVFVYQFQVGYTGHTYQHFDFFQRNAFYGNLISYPWPVVLPDGREMSYNLAFWLPPAFLCKLLAMGGVDCSSLSGVPGWVILLWNVLLMYATLLLVFLKLKKVSFLFVLFFLGIGDAAVVFDYMPSMMGWLGQPMRPCFWSGELMVTCCNQFPFAYLAVALMLQEGRPVWFYLVCGSLLLLVAPLSSLVLFVFLAGCMYKAWAGMRAAGVVVFSRGFVAWQAWAAYGLAGVAGVYYMRAEEPMAMFCVFRYVDGCSGVLKWLVPVALNFVLLNYLPWRYGRCRVWLLCANVALLALPAVYMGGMNNELIMKGMPVVMFVFACLWAEAWYSGPRVRRDVLVWCCVAYTAVRLCGFVAVRVQKILPTWANWTYNVCDPFQGHLYHPGMAIDQSVPGTREAKLPHVFLTKPGASEEGALWFLCTPPSEKYEKDRYAPVRSYDNLDKPLPSIPHGLKGL